MEKLSAWQAVELIALVRAEVDRTPAPHNRRLRVLLATLEDAQYLYIKRWGNSNAQ